MSNSSNSNSSNDDEQKTVKVANVKTENTMKFSEEAIDSDPVEYDLRRQLIALDKAEEDTRAKKKELLSKLWVLDEARRIEVSQFTKLVEERSQEMRESESESGRDLTQQAREDLICPRVEEEARETEEQQSTLAVNALGVSFLTRMMSSTPRGPKSVKSSKSSRKEGYRCGECRLIFSTRQDREDHCRHDHGIVCEQCGEVFKSFRALDDHKDYADHWGDETDEYSMPLPTSEEDEYSMPSPLSEEAEE
jgi:hypothetical protein